MATSMVSLTAKTWKLVSSVSVLFQVPEQNDSYAIEALALPTDTTIRKKIQPGEIYSFQKVDGNLYMYSPNGNIEVAIDTV